MVTVIMELLYICRTRTNVVSWFLASSTEPLPLESGGSVGDKGGGISVSFETTAGVPALLRGLRTVGLGQVISMSVSGQKGRNSS